MTIEPVETYNCPRCEYERTILKSELNDLYPSREFTCHQCDCKYELILTLFINVINLTELESSR